LGTDETEVVCISISHNNKKIAVGRFSGVINIYSLKFDRPPKNKKEQTPKELIEMQNPETILFRAGQIQKILWSDENLQLFVSYSKAPLVVLNIEDHTTLYNFNTFMDSPPKCFLLSYARGTDALLLCGNCLYRYNHG
jgi:hypothetical protein